VLAIGVTGHRFLAETEKLKKGIDQALDRIERSYPGSSWSILSSLAEGADRLVLERVLARKPASRLVVPLPLPVCDYLQDFATQESREAFLRLLGQAAEVIPPPPGSTRNEWYVAAGKYMLEVCEVLVALWDGQGAQGTGGTAEMVATARQRRLPLAWVRCGNRVPGTNTPLSLGEEQGTVSFDGFQD
jgi:hypothetical protein